MPNDTDNKNDPPLIRPRLRSPTLAWADVHWRSIDSKPTNDEPLDGEPIDGGRDNAAVAPYSNQYDDIYFAGRGLEETRHVFIDGNRLTERFHGAKQFAIGETGFGSGLNFLATLDAWRRAKKPSGAHLDYIACERHPMRSEDIARTLKGIVALAPLTKDLLDTYPPRASGFHRLAIGDDASLTLIFDEAADALSHASGHVDAWFLDGFSPAQNPDMWRPAVYEQIARLSAPGASLATFTVAGAVRRGLTEAGFQVEKTPGFGRKREMLRAHFQPNDDASPAVIEKPWFTAPPSIRTDTKASPTIAIIGGGVAGASLAHAARRRGLAPTLFDPKGLAGGASGNPGGLIMPRLDLGDGAAARFFRQAYIHALATLKRLNAPATANSAPSLFNACGVTLAATDDAVRKKQEQLLRIGALPPELMQLTERGLFFPQAGVVAPPAYVKALASDTPLIERRVIDVIASDSGGAPQIILDTNETTSFDAIVIAAGAGSLFPSLQGLTISGVAGQIDLFPDASSPKHAIAAGPYAAPAPGGGAIVGATYEPTAPGAAPSPSTVATRSNIEAAEAVSPDLKGALTIADAQPRVAVRAQTPDRLPAVGALPDWAYYANAYDGLRHGRKGPYPTGRALSGLYVLSGLGSRGLVTAPLAAEIAIAGVLGAPAPVAADVLHALHPSRFFIRALKRGEIRSIEK